jgi:hypothetical protein
LRCYKFKGFADRIFEKELASKQELPMLTSLSADIMPTLNGRFLIS